MDRIIVDGHELIIPDEKIVAHQQIPLSIWQSKTNQLFYTRDDSPLDHIGTLGSVDPLLPKAMAKDFLESGPKVNKIHEIGPGNFSFARSFLDYIDSEVKGLTYSGHDFSESSYAFVKDKLDKYSGRISFSKNSLSEFPSAVLDDPLQVMLVEVLDDVTTEFFTMHNGLEYILCVQPEMSARVHFPNRLKHSNELARKGDFSLTTQRMMAKGVIEKEYSAQDIIGIINSFNWRELGDIHPDFLKCLGYDEKGNQFNPFKLGDIYQYHWKNMPKEFEAFGKEMISQFRKQLMQSEDTQIIHFPVAGLSFLWQLRNRTNMRMDFFDYGYDSTKSWVTPMTVYNGQITAPVNFEMMQYASEYLGFDATLETNREFIKRTLGEDTIPVGYITKAFSGSKFPYDKVKETLYEAFRKKVTELTPNIVPTRDDILSCRIRRNEYDSFMQACKEANLVKPDFEVSEGSFHLSVYK